MAGPGFGLASVLEPPQMGRRAHGALTTRSLGGYHPANFRSRIVGEAREWVAYDRLCQISNQAGKQNARRWMKQERSDAKRTTRIQ